MIDVLGEEVMRKIFSSTWALREEGINEVEDIVRNASKRRNGEPDYFVNAVGVCRLTISDKMAGVAQRSMGFLASVCKLYPDVHLDGSQRSQFQTYSDPIVQELTHKIGDNLLKVRNSAEEAHAAVAAHPQFGVKLCLNHLVSDAPPPTKAKPKGGKKPVLTSKQIAARYRALYSMLLELSFTPD